MGEFRDPGEYGEDEDFEVVGIRLVVKRQKTVQEAAQLSRQCLHYVVVSEHVVK